MDKQKIIWAVVIVVVVGLAAWLLGVFGDGKQVTDVTPPPATEAPASATPPATTEPAPATPPATTEPAPATPPATTP